MKKKLQIAITQEMFDQLQAEASKQMLNVSDVVRIACINFLKKGDN